MSEYWKSTPKYWCKHCACYVRDTKLERQNHDATGKHQGALKRFLRDLHRGHEREEREKEYARREIARVSGVVDGSSSSAGPSTAYSASARRDAPGVSSAVQLQRQREQLAEMGVAMPSEVQPEMAIPGQWTVTKTRVIDTGGDPALVEARATGVRKREVTEEEQDEEEAVKGLFKKPRRWGRDTKAMPLDEDKELDALLSGSTFQPNNRDEDIKQEEDAADDKANVKVEDTVAKEEAPDSTTVKTEVSAQETPVKPEPDVAGESGIAPVVFKKRKPKGIRQK